MRCSPISATTTSRALCAAVVALLAAAAADAHFCVDRPVASREKQAYPADNRRFFPLDQRPSPDCLQYPRGAVATVTPGQLVVGFEIGNGARHVGLCTAQLINLQTNAQVDLGQQKDCVHDFDAMTVTLPSAPCPSCVVKVKVTATHLGADRPEFYDSCLDVSIGGNADPAPSPTPAPSLPVPTTPPANVVPTPTANPQVPDTPTDPAAPADPAAPGNPAPVPTNPMGPPSGRPRFRPGRGRRGQDDNVTPAPPAAAACVAGAACSTEGSYACSAAGDAVCQCARGIWYTNPVPLGTQCTNSPSSGVHLVRSG